MAKRPSSERSQLNEAAETFADVEVTIPGLDLEDFHMVLYPERPFWVIPHPPTAPAFAGPSLLAQHSL